MRLTYCTDDEEDKKRVQDGQQGRSKRRDDVAQRADSAEEADDPKGADRAEHIDRHRDGTEGNEGEGHYADVEHVPTVTDEGAEPDSTGRKMLHA